MLSTVSDADFTKVDSNGVIHPPVGQIWAIMLRSAERIFNDTPSHVRDHHLQKQILALRPLRSRIEPCTSGRSRRACRPRGRRTTSPRRALPPPGATRWCGSRAMPACGSSASCFRGSRSPGRWRTFPARTVRASSRAEGWPARRVVDYQRLVDPSRVRVAHQPAMSKTVGSVSRGEERDARGVRPVATGVAPVSAAVFFGFRGRRSSLSVLAPGTEARGDAAGGGFQRDAARPRPTIHGADARCCDGSRSCWGLGALH
jgi:hypothetical protein